MVKCLALSKREEIMGKYILLYKGPTTDMDAMPDEKKVEVMII